jgi:hypothetical protein
MLQHDRDEGSDGGSDSLVGEGVFAFVGEWTLNSERRPTRGRQRDLELTSDQRHGVKVSSDHHLHVSAAEKTGRIRGP